ncbi:Bro-N domain-containing protein [Candidatus Pacearchaeota archaeon]|nr:Bro-N domain-containing protein [Candidatus Pacearchaeota archaeon]
MIEDDNTTHIAVFGSKAIRRRLFNNEWWFVAADIISTLTESKDPNGYLKDMRRRDEGFNEGWGQIATLLEITTSGGKQKINCVSTKGAFRLIQSIPSKKAEPFKRWLAKVGYERVQEIENPELAQERMKQLYEQKGYSKEWIEKRLRGIAIRQELTDEWKNRGIKEEKEFAILTNEISKAAFGKTVEEYKEFKKLKRENLRDHMDDLEIIFTMLGEAATTRITKTKDAEGLSENKVAARQGGEVAGNARKELESKTGESVLMQENFLAEPEKLKKKRKKLLEQVNVI